MIDIILGHYNYWIVVFLMMAGFYTVISRGNLIKKIAGLNIFQTSVFLLYISIGTDTDCNCSWCLDHRAWPCSRGSY
jgi:multicomponent Na+:H+ antiporter subunit C